MCTIRLALETPALHLNGVYTTRHAQHDIVLVDHNLLYVCISKVITDVSVMTE